MVMLILTVVPSAYCTVSRDVSGRVIGEGYASSIPAEGLKIGKCTETYALKQK